jgi:Skp family chaperone for outer membrane proteins
MKTLLISLALATAAIAAPVAAQTLPPAVIVIVDLDSVFQTSAAGKQALAELKTRADAIQARLQTLRTSFGTEEQALVSTRPTAPGAAATAWEAKARDFQTRKTQAEQELAKRDQDLQASRQFVVKQLNDATQPIISTIMKERGASIALAEGATLQHAASIDVTTDVIARLDAALPRVVSTAPAAPAK